MTQWTTAFWALFALMGAVVVAGTLTKVIFMDILLGFLVVAIGVLKLSEELEGSEIREKHSNIDDSIKYLTHRVDSGNALATRLRDRHENRFLHLESRRMGMERKIEDNYDSLAKKIIQHENKVNDVVKAIVEVARRHDTLARESADDLKNLQKLKKKTDAAYRKLTSIQKRQQRQQEALKTLKAKKRAKRRKR